MALVCAISQQTPEEPVVSPSSGCVFEKRLIIKYLEEFGKDPISNVPLTVDMLIEIKNPAPVVKPRPPEFNTIPDILKLLRDEWDSCKLETFNTRQQLLATRQELQDALYQADASFRIIHRLESQLKEARDILTNLKPLTTVDSNKRRHDSQDDNVSNVNNENKRHHHDEMEVEEEQEHRQQHQKQQQRANDASKSSSNGTSSNNEGDNVVGPLPPPPSLGEKNGENNMTTISSNEAENQTQKAQYKSSSYDALFVPKAESLASQLTAERKVRMKTEPEGFTSAEALAEYETTAEYPGIHTTQGILCLDICRNNSALIVTGGKDNNVVLFDKDQGKILKTLKGHTKPVHKVIFHPEKLKIISASEDATIRIWQPMDEQPLKHTLRVHNDKITDISLHPSGQYLLSSARDSSWSITDIYTGDLIRRCVLDFECIGGNVGDAVDTGKIEITASQFHPDGLLFATGVSDSTPKGHQVLIWDVKQKTDGKVEAKLEGHENVVTTMAFSENGYHLASSEEHCVKMWDLRKQTCIKTIVLDSHYIKDLSFDLTGTYLALCGRDIRLYSCKKQGQRPRWSTIRILEGHKVSTLQGAVTGVRFGHNASFVASASLDKYVKIHSLVGADKKG